MIDIDELDKKTPREKWELLAALSTCPFRLAPLVGSRVLDEDHSQDDPRTTRLIVELAPGMTHDAIVHLKSALASFWDLPIGSVWIEAQVAKARRVEITLVEPAA